MITNTIILFKSNPYIFSDIEKLERSEFGIILGSSVYRDQVSIVVRDRIDAVVKLYKNNKIGKILVTGDRSEKFYDEVKTIKLWLVKEGIPKENIIEDFEGYSTYESIFRAVKLFKLKNSIIVSQKFHLPRAVYIARETGMEAQGYVADNKKYQNIVWYQMREFFARIKDYIFVNILKPQPFP